MKIQLPSSEDEKRVENIELFYDLIFVYCVSKLTQLIGPLILGTGSWGLFPVYVTIFAIIMQIWIFTVYIYDRYLTPRIYDVLCLLINMFLLYFMANSVSINWQGSFARFHIGWILVLLNLGVHLLLREFFFKNEDQVQSQIMKRRAWIILSEAALAGISTLLFMACRFPWLSLIALLWGIILSQLSSGLYMKRPVHFSYLSERVSLVVIISFGEMVTGIAEYFQSSAELPKAIVVFTLMTALFLLYTLQYGKYIDRNHKTAAGIYTLMHIPLITSINILTGVLEVAKDNGADLDRLLIWTAAALLIWFACYLFLFYYQPGKKIHRSKDAILQNAVGSGAVAAVFCLVIGYFTRSFYLGLGLTSCVLWILTLILFGQLNKSISAAS